MKIRLYTFSFFLICSVTLVWGAMGINYNYSFRSLEVEQGLSQNMIYSIMQDSKGFLWFGTQDGLNRYDGLNFTVFKTNDKEPYSIGSNSIFTFYEHDDGRIWVGTKNGVYIYNPVDNRFKHLRFNEIGSNKIVGITRDIKRDNNNNVWFTVEDRGLFCYTVAGSLIHYSMPGISIRKLAFDENNRVWMATYGKGLIRFDPKTKEYKKFKIKATQEYQAENDINDLLFINSSQLLVGTSSKGVLLFDTKSEKYETLANGEILNENLFVRCLFQTKNQTIWIGSESGIYIYDFKTQETIHLQHNSNDRYSLTDNAVHSMYQDNEQTMWVGTFFGGINYYSPYFSTFKKYYPIYGMNSIKGKSISEFCEDDKRNLWIATEDAGLSFFNPRTKNFTSIDLPASNIHALLYDEDKLWVGTFSDGLFLLNANSNKIISHYKSSIAPNTLIDNNVYSVFRDSSGEIWVGTMTGLQVYSKATNDFRRIQEELIRSQVNDIVEDYWGVLWFATIGDGLFSYNKLTEAWTHYKDPFQKGGFASKSIICMMQDSRHRLWLGSEGHGLSMYQQDSKSFSTPITTANGLPNDVIYKLVDDGRDIWGSTNKGIFRFNPESNEIISYTYVHGLIGDQFNYKSGIRTTDGEIYFGGVKGFISFSPSKLMHNENIPPIVISELKINNIPIGMEKSSSFNESIIYSKSIKIPPKSSNITISFAALSYVSPLGNNYTYQLEGFDSKWSVPSNRNEVSYTDLPAGHYVFSVKGSNSEGLWNDAGVNLDIIVLPPWYRTNWAYALYLITAISILFFTIRNLRNKSRRRHEYLIKEFEKNKEIELYDSKINFFTNITHEIRTPLTLIKLPLEEVIKNTHKENENWDDLGIIQKNVTHLHDLVNELLDLKKIESKEYALNFKSCDIVTLIEDIVENFRPSARLKNLSIACITSSDSYLMELDRVLFTKILNNLLSNALKHAESKIEVLFSQNTSTSVRIRVLNDGYKIPEKYKDKIFEPFFKINPHIRGAGIGLPFAKTLVELHSGELFYEVSENGFTSFVVELPIEPENKNVAQLNGSLTGGEHNLHDAKNRKTVNEFFKKNNNKPSVLLVEDNTEFIGFLTKQLKPMFNVHQALNGVEALSLVAQENFDLIISDIMMPVMDGLTMCEKLKSDVKTSHIPIILLTAKTNIQSKIEGITIGADEYIEKPFSKDFLIARIFNLIDSRKRLIDSYRNSPEPAYESLTHTKVDDEFMQRLIEIIYKNLDNSNFTVDVIADEMNLSRATLYRKINSISDLTPNEFIQLTRLKKAAELLRKNEFRVNEIAYMVGFSSPNYFSKCFFKQFGVQPKNFV